METRIAPWDILIFDIQLLAMEGLKAVLKEENHITETVSSRHELMKALKNKIPDILFMDYFMVDFDGFEELKDLMKGFPDMSIVILTNTITRSELIELNNLGIKNILHKNLEKDELFSCLEAVRKNKKYYSGDILDMMLDLNEKKGVPDETAQLTASEIEIVRLIAEGLTNKEIACRKHLSVHTIMTHRKNILRKLGVSNASELIMCAIRKGFIDTIEYHI
jgi:DNA-binding NarL/FixJ family response regulator